MHSNHISTVHIATAVTGAETRPTTARRRGHSLRRRVSLALAAAGLAVSVAPIATMADAGTASASSSCLAECMGPMGTARELGENRFAFNTKLPVHSKFVVRDASGAVIRMIDGPAGHHTSHFFTVTGLTWGKTYTYQAIVTGLDGVSYSEGGSFTTAKRTMVVRITSVKITDDSDVGAGEIAAYARLGSGPAVTLWSERSISATSRRDVSQTWNLAGPSTGEVMRVQLVDDDCDFGELCTSGGSPSFTTFSNSLWDSTAKVFEVKLPMFTHVGPGAVQYWSSTASGPIDFTVYGTVQVTVS
jgi:hypothetical protein